VSSRLLAQQSPLQWRCLRRRRQSGSVVSGTGGAWAGGVVARGSRQPVGFREESKKAARLIAPCYTLVGLTDKVQSQVKSRGLSMVITRSRYGIQGQPQKIVGGRLSHSKICRQLFHCSIKVSFWFWAICRVITTWLVKKELIARSQVSNRWENGIDSLAEFNYLQWNYLFAVLESSSLNSGLHEYESIVRVEDKLKETSSNKESLELRNNGRFAGDTRHLSDADVTMATLHTTPAFLLYSLNTLITKSQVKNTTSKLERGIFSHIL